MISESYQEYFVSGVIFLFIGIFLSFIFRKHPLFISRPVLNSKDTVLRKVMWYHVLIGFACLIFIQYLFLKTIDLFFPYLTHSEIFKDWIFHFGIALLFLFLIVFLKIENLGSIIYRNKKDIKIGFLALLLALPWVLLSSILGLFIVEYFKLPFAGQGSYQYLLDLNLSSPIFYAFSIISVTISPFIEEVLFRGFLQNFIMKFLGGWVGIIITSLIFAIAHYEFNQGLSSIRLLIPCFISSCFLCYLYYKTGSVISCSVFHMSFNFLSLIVLLLGKVLL